MYSDAQIRNILAVANGEVRRTPTGRVGGNLHTLRVLERDGLILPPRPASAVWVLTANGRRAARRYGWEG